MPSILVQTHARKNTSAPSELHSSFVGISIDGAVVQVQDAIFSIGKPVSTNETMITWRPGRSAVFAFHSFVPADPAATSFVQKLFGTSDLAASDDIVIERHGDGIRAVIHSPSRSPDTATTTIASIALPRDYEIAAAATTLATVSSTNTLLSAWRTQLSNHYLVSPDSITKITSPLLAVATGNGHWVAAGGHDQVMRLGSELMALWYPKKRSKALRDGSYIHEYIRDPHEPTAQSTAGRTLYSWPHAANESAVAMEDHGIWYLADSMDRIQRYLIGRDRPQAIGDRLSVVACGSGISGRLVAATDQYRAISATSTDLLQILGVEFQVASSTTDIFCLQ